MAAPTRPVGGAPVATDWGQKTHDLTFVPPGCNANSATITGIATTLLKMALTVGGPNLNSGDFLVPTGGEGVYALFATCTVTTLGGATNWRIYIYKNGAVAIGGNYFKIDSNGGGSNVFGFLTLAAGDRIAIYTSGGGGTSGAQAVGSLWAVKIAESLS